MPHDFANIQPEKPSITKVAAQLADDKLPGRPLPKFVYAAHPGAWEYVDKATGFLPRLKKIPLIPGVNGCRPGPNGHLPVLASLARKGWTVIDESDVVIRTDPNGNLVRDKGYLYKYPGKRGAIYQDCWSHPSLIGYGPTAQVDWATQYDRAGFDAWRAHLRDSGRVPAPTAGVMAQALKLQTRRAARRIVDGHDGNPHVQAHVKREQQRLEDMRNAAAEAGARVKGKKRKAKAKPERANV